MATIQDASAKGPSTRTNRLRELTGKATLWAMIIVVVLVLGTILAAVSHASCENQCGVTQGLSGTLHSSGQGNTGALMRAIESKYPRTQYFDVRTNGFAGYVNLVSGWLSSWGFYERSNTVYSRYNASRGAASTNDTRGYGGWSW